MYRDRKELSAEGLQRHKCSMCLNLIHLEYCVSF